MTHTAKLSAAQGDVSPRKSMGKLKDAIQAILL
jgi:hypothetical protein